MSGGVIIVRKRSIHCWLSTKQKCNGYGRRSYLTPVPPRSARPTPCRGPRGSGSDDYSKYCRKYFIRTRGMLAPHHKAIAPTSAVVLMEEREGMQAKKSSAACCTSEFGSARSVSRFPGSVSPEDIDYCTNHRPGASLLRIP